MKFDHEDIIKKYSSAKDAWSTIFKNYIADSQFAYGEQWDSAIKSLRARTNRSTLVYNTLPSYIRYITNNARSCTPSIKVHPISDGATKDVSKIIDGIIKSIEHNSDAKQAYVRALECSITGGIGVFKVVVDEDDNEDPCLVIKEIKDPTSVLFDMSAEHSNFSDSKFCFYVKWVDKEAFKAEYPDVNIAEVDTDVKDWYSDDSVQVAEFWSKSKDGIEYYLINGSEILEYNDQYKGKYIPFCFVGGSETYINGTRDFKGIVRDVIDQQKMLNYSKSETADYMTKSAKSQWLVDANAISPYQTHWDSINIESIPYLPYNSKAGNIPQPVAPQIPPSGFMTTSQEAMTDIRSTIGIKDPLQDIPASQSGKAIQLQIQQGNIGTFGFLDKLNSAIKYCGKVIVDLIPSVYSFEHIAEVLGEDGELSTVQVNKPYEEDGKIINNDLTKGKYGITISTGPSYESQRSEATDRLVDLIDKYPSMMQLAGDIIVKNLDFKGADELADRLRATIDPKILAATQTANDKDTAVTILQNQIQVMNAQLQQLVQVNQELQNNLQMASAQINDQEKARLFEMQKLQLSIAAQEKLKQMDIMSRLQLESVKGKNSVDLENIKSQNDLNETMVESKLKQEETIANNTTTVHIIEDSPNLPIF